MAREILHDQTAFGRARMRAGLGIALAVGLAGAPLTQANSLPWPFAPVPRTGPAQYQAHCGGCHALDHHKFGPMHRNVVGRAAATQPRYRYSPALLRSGVIWTEATLDAWIADPGRVVLGTRMSARLNDPGARQLIIGYLKDNTAGGVAAP